ncbi:MAG TPA: TraB/GumN family protein [Rhodanobacter sp.]
MPNPDAEAPDIDGDVRDPDAEVPGIDEDVRNLDAEVPNVDGDVHNSDAEVPDIDGDVRNPGAEVAEVAEVGGDRPDLDGEVPAIDRHLRHPDIAVPQANGPRHLAGIELATTCRDTPDMKPSITLRLLACLALLLLACAPALAKPALWVVKDADTTIYLFGTVHLMPSDASWHDPALDRAMADSQTLYIELTDDDPANMAALVLRHGMDATHPLSSQLSPSEAHRLDLLANKLGVPGGMQTLNVMRPWLAALTLAVTPLLKAGLDPEHGVDKQLKAQMSAAGKPVLGLETAEQQIRFLADMPRAIELALLRSTMRDADQGAFRLTELIDAWRAGDVDTIARIGNDDMRQHEPKLYQRLLVQRNQVWATKVAAMLRQPGTVFIAVGAAHLAGPDSVQAQLQKLGIEATRQ